MPSQYKTRNIIALSTAPINSPLAIIKMSGEDVINIFSKIFDSKNFSINKLKNHNIFFGNIVFSNSKKVLDEVIALIYKKPFSFTGENSVEIICHGNIILVDKIIGLLIENGASLANPGEFSKQAFLNCKLDILKAEAINNLIKSRSNISLNISTNNMLGKTSDFINNIKSIMIAIISSIEVSIDYPEYKEYKINKENIYKKIIQIKDDLNVILNDSEIYNQINNYIKVAIIGKPNVGKSSLLNALIKQDKAIISNIPGTTRDVVEGEIVLKNVNLKILDTAGIRNANSKNEELGIKKTFQVINDADLVLYVVDKDNNISEKMQKILLDKAVIYVQNKSDLYKNNFKNFISISAKNNDISQLVTKIEENFYKINVDWENKVIFFNSNLSYIKKLIKQINLIIENIKDNTSIDLILLEFYETFKILQEILGENLDLDISEKIFSKYCIGK